MSARTGAREPYTESLVFTESTDGVPLGGALIAPADGPVSDLAVVWIHGGAAKFYERHYITIGRELAARGHPFLTGNTRGHDAFTLVARGEDFIPAGSSFERYDEAPLDVAAWVDYAATLGPERVVLIGHSIGACKVVYYQAERRDSRVRGLAAASPPDRWPGDPERIALAGQMVAEGRGEDPLPHLEGTPSWNIVSAQMVFTRDQIMRHAFYSATQEPFIAAVQAPLLVIYGGAEEVADGWFDALRENARSAVSLQIETIAGADHDYAGHEQEAAALIAAWMERHVQAGDG